MTDKQFEKLLAVMRPINISLGIIVGILILLATGVCPGTP